MYRARGFDRDVHAALPKLRGEFDDSWGNHRLAAGEYDMARGNVLGGAIDNAAEGEIFAFGMP